MPASRSALRLCAMAVPGHAGAWAGCPWDKEGHARACPYLRFFLISCRVLPRRGLLSASELAGLAPAIHERQSGVHAFPPGESRVGEPPGRRAADERKQGVCVRYALTGTSGSTDLLFRSTVHERISGVARESCPCSNMARMAMPPPGGSRVSALRRSGTAAPSP
jgi:hypothetical protein